MVLPSNAATTWNAADRVSVVGKQIVSKNSLPSTMQFKVVNGAADNSTSATTKVIQVSSTDLTYTGNDNEVAYVVAHELGGVINDNLGKTKVRNMLKNAVVGNLDSDNIVAASLNSTYASNLQATAVAKEADVMATDLVINAGYNPLAGIVVLNKMPGSSMEILQGKPANSERAMNIYDYLTYNYPAKISAGYGCNEYRAFLAYADPIVKERTSTPKKLAKWNKSQEKIKTNRAKQLAKYKATGGLSSWGVTYDLLQSITEPQAR